MPYPILFKLHFPKEKLARLPTFVRHGVMEGLKKAGAEIVDYLREKAPRRTGALAESLRFTVTAEREGPALWIKGLKYGRILELGRQAFRPGKPPGYKGRPRPTGVFMPILHPRRLHVHIGEEGEIGIFSMTAGALKPTPWLGREAGYMISTMRAHAFDGIAEAFEATGLSARAARRRARRIIYG